MKKYIRIESTDKDRKLINEKILKGEIKYAYYAFDDDKYYHYYLIIKE